MSDKKATRACPFCKEDVKADAIRCKHCHARIAPVGPTHGGVCPYCKEDINLEAIRCKHCHADVGSAGELVKADGCGCGGRGQPPRRMIKRVTRDRTPARTRTLAREYPPLSSQCAGCPLSDVDGYGTWCLESCDEEYCTLWLCEPTTEPGVLV